MMRAYCIMTATSMAAVALTFAPEAVAGTTHPLSTIGALSAPVPVSGPPKAIAGIVLKTTIAGIGTDERHDLTAATKSGYCITKKQPGYAWFSAYSAHARSQTEDLALDRLTEKDGVAILERTRVHLDPPSGTITATDRSQVVLKEVARGPEGVVVWAFHEGSSVVVLARHVERGVESRQLATDEDPTLFASVYACPFAGVRIDARNPRAGAFAQLLGALPAQGTGKDKVIPRFVIDASVSRVTRDPEPLLAVRVQML